MLNINIRQEKYVLIKNTLYTWNCTSQFHCIFLRNCKNQCKKKSNYHLLSYFNCEIHNCLNKKIAQLKISIYSLLPQRTAIQILSPLGKDENGGEETN